MAVVRRIFVSGPRERYLDARTRALRASILNAIRDLGYECTAFGTPAGGSGLAAASPWTAAAAMAAMRRCVGAVLLGFPYWRIRDESGERGLVTEYCHYEAALAGMLDLPVLALIETGCAQRGAFDARAGNAVFELPADATAALVQTTDFQAFLAGWHARLRARCDLFLGYSSRAGELADRILSELEGGGVTVLDWRRDFRKGGTIMAEITDAASRCSAAVLLFTRDDLLQSKSAEAEAMPRDNVLLEAGYFTHAKGGERVLIVREQGARMPADLGGAIYVPYEPGDLASVLEGVQAFVRARL